MGDRYLEVLLQIGLTFNQFPNDEHILQRDVKFLLDLLPKFNGLTGTRGMDFLFECEHVVKFTLLIVYQCVLSTRYDLCLEMWRGIKALEYMGSQFFKYRVCGGRQGIYSRRP